MADVDGGKWLDEHMRRAEKFEWAFYFTALLAAAAIAAPFKWKKSALPLAVATLVLAAGSVALAGWISHAGGQVRHREFRDGPPPNVEEDAHEHHTHEH